MKIDCKKVMESSPLPSSLGGTMSKPFECDTCTASFFENKLLIEHSKQHVDEQREKDHQETDKIYECDVCYLSFPDKHDLTAHMEVHSYTRKTEENEENQSPELFECKICYLSFPGSKELKEHVEDHSGECTVEKVSSDQLQKVFECDVCYLSFPAEKDLLNHMNTHSKQIKKFGQGANRNPKYLECEVCYLAFPSNKSLREHSKTHATFFRLKTVAERVEFLKDKAVDSSSKTGKQKPDQKKMFTEDNVTVECKTGNDDDKKFECEIFHLAYKEKHKLDKHVKVHSEAHGTSDEHKSSNEKQKSFMCKICSDSFSDNSTLKEHIKEHVKLLERSLAEGKPISGQKELVCKLCNVTFNVKKLLIEHMKSHQGRNSSQGAPKLSACSISFKDKKLLTEHLNTHLNKTVKSKPEKTLEDEKQNSSVCDVYNTTCTEKQKLDEHQKVHLKERSSNGEPGKDKIPTMCICEICNIPFSDYKCLSEHLKLHLDGTIPAKEVEAPSSKGTAAGGAEEASKTLDYVCRICNAAFAKKNNLTKHSKIHLVEKPYKCEICGIQCTTKSNMTAHMMIHTGEKPYKCTICDAAFSKRCNLVKHHSIHTGEKAYKCYFCEAGFSNRSNMVAHMRLHTGEKPYKCDTCNATFLLESKLIKHQRIHTGERPYKCNICGAAFIHKGSLSKHMKRQIHTGEHPFKCVYCDLELTSQVRLTNHLRTHTEEKAYKCDSCHAEFSMKCTLAIHQKIHTGEKPFKCDECDAAFSQRGSLTVHQRIHAGHMPFKCHICDAAYFQKGSLAVHMKLHANSNGTSNTYDEAISQYQRNILNEIMEMKKKNEFKEKYNLTDTSASNDRLNNDLNDTKASHKQESGKTGFSDRNQTSEEINGKSVKRKKTEDTSESDSDEDNHMYENKIKYLKGSCEIKTEISKKTEKEATLTQKHNSGNSEKDYGKNSLSNSQYQNKSGKTRKDVMNSDAEINLIQIKSKLRETVDKTSDQNMDGNNESMKNKAENQVIEDRFGNTEMSGVKDTNTERNKTLRSPQKKTKLKDENESRKTSKESIHDTKKTGFDQRRGYTKNTSSFLDYIQKFGVNHFVSPSMSANNRLAALFGARNTEQEQTKEGSQLETSPQIGGDVYRSRYSFINQYGHLVYKQK